MMCARCEELEAEVFYLKSELDALGSESSVETLARVLRIRPGSAKTVVRLYASRGKMTASWALMEASADPASDDHRDPKLVSVHIHSARRALGFDAILTAWGRGYSLSDTGMAKVAAILGDAR